MQMFCNSFFSQLSHYSNSNLLFSSKETGELYNYLKTAKYAALKL